MSQTCPTSHYGSKTYPTCVSSQEVVVEARVLEPQNLSLQLASVPGQAHGSPADRATPYEKPWARPAMTDLARDD